MPALRKAWIWLALVDSLLLGLAFVSGFAVTLGWPPPTSNLQSFQIVLPFMTLAHASIYFGTGLYWSKRFRFADILRTVTIAEGLLFLSTLALSFWLRGFAFPRSVVLVGFSVHYGLAMGWRMTLWAIQQRRTKPQRVVIVARTQEAVGIVQKFLCEPPGWFDLQCAVEPEEILNLGERALQPIDILVIGPSVPLEQRARLLRSALRAGTAVQVIPDLGDVLMVGALPNQIDDIPTLEVRPLAFTPGQQVAKRVFDLVIALAMFLVAMPVMLFVALAIRLSSPGPIFYGQVREGRNGRAFTMHKFRTMVVDAERSTGPVLASAADPRVTSIGRFLRARRLDELPQLWNVIRGDMSLVGPRPERPEFTAQFATELPDYRFREVVAPGLTGLAQVMGKYATTAQDKLRFDLFYIRNYSVWLDLQILLLTARAVLTSGTAAGVARGATEQDAEAILRRSFDEVATTLDIEGRNV